MYTLNVLFENAKLSPVQVKKIKEGETLLEVFLRNNIVIRHDCGGVCHCTTCHVYVERGEAFLEEPTKREKDFLKKVAGFKATSRLACQCLLAEGNGEIEVLLPNAQ